MCGSVIKGTEFCRVPVYGPFISGGVSGGSNKFGRCVTERAPSG